MSNARSQQNDVKSKTVVYEAPGMEAVVLRGDVEYQTSEAGALTLDLYTPPESKAGERRPAVVFVAGYPDPGMEMMLGCKFKEMGQIRSWGRLVAASGLVGVAYTNRSPAADLTALLQYLRRNAASLGIDENRICLWACSGNVPVALSALMQGSSGSFKCAVLMYGYMLDLGASTRVADAAAQFRFANPCAGKGIEELPQELPLFLVRAGQDHIPHLNETMDLFLAASVARNMPVTFVNHPKAPHAFDLVDDSEVSREVIRRALDFLRLSANR